MKILIMSDSHGNRKAMLKAVESESPEMILHLGDYDRDCSALMEKYPEIPLHSVRGNCDRSSDGRDTFMLTLGGKRVLMTHGHLYRVKSGISIVKDNAIARGADVLLFGHTHIPYYDPQAGLTMINPGSVGMGGKTYAVLEIKNGVVICDMKSVGV